MKTVAEVIGVSRSNLADRGNDAVLVIDDTAIAKKGTHSVGVAA
jgi:SRSO17 transposase